MNSLPPESDARVLELAEEFAQRHRNGEAPTIESYAEQHPDLANEIREVFPILLVLEEYSPEESEPDEHHMDGHVIGDFRIVRELGRGGMGIVFEAEQLSLGRRVALKILPNSIALSEKNRRRFLREAKAAAKLHHTNIVPVYGVGNEDGLHFYYMQYIEGAPLDEVIAVLRETKAIEGGDVAVDRLTDSGPDADGQLNSETTNIAKSVTSGNSTTGSLSEPSSSRDYWKNLACIAKDVCDALTYAHRMAILHRDIKPANLIYDDKGRTWITDFGLAKMAHDEQLTNTGDMIGTLRYMPPESFQGRATEQSDIYSLGLTLYELVALRPAFAAREREPLVADITAGNIPRLTTLRTGVPRDLQTIIEKSIEVDPRKRYRSAQELSDDLQRFIADEPIRARRVTAPERLLRWATRNPALATSVSLAILIAFAFFAVVVYDDARLRGLAQKLETQRDTSDDQRRRADENFDLAQESFQRLLLVLENEGARGNVAPGMKRMLNQIAQEYFEEFIENRKEDPLYRRDIAVAYSGLASTQDQLGIHEKAREFHQTATDRFEALLKEGTDFRGRTGAADHFLLWSNWLARMGESEKSLDALDRASALLRDLVEDRPGDSHLNEQQLKAAVEIARQQAREGRLSDVEPVFDKEIEKAKELVKRFPTSKGIQLLLVRTLLYRGDLDASRMRWRQAMAYFKEGLEQSKNLPAESPERMFELSAASNRVVQSYLQAGIRNTETRQYLAGARDAATKLFERYPSLTRAKSLLGWARYYDALLAAGEARWEAAMEAAKESVKLSREVYELTKTTDALRAVIESSNVLGTVYSRKRNPAAVPLFLDAIKKADELTKIAKDVPMFQRQRAVVLHNLMSYYITGADWPKAEEWYPEVVASWKGLMEDKDSLEATLISLAATHRMIAKAYRFQNKHEEMLSALRASVKAGEDLEMLGGEPDLKGHATSLSGCGNALHFKGKLQEALSYYSRAVNFVRERRPIDRRMLGLTLAARAAAFDDLKEFQRARSDWDGAVEYTGSTIPNFRFRRGLAAIRCGDARQAREDADWLEEKPGQQRNAKILREAAKK